MQFYDRLIVLLLFAFLKPTRLKEHGLSFITPHLDEDLNHFSTIIKNQKANEQFVCYCVLSPRLTIPANSKVELNYTNRSIRPVIIRIP